MKRFLLPLLLLINLAAFSQEILPAPDYNYRQTKATIITNDNNRFNVEQIALVGSDVRFVYDKKTMPNSYAHDTINLIPVSNIKSIKVRRGAFLAGAGVGAVPGFLLGYGIGYLTHNDKDDLPTDENKERRNSRSGLIGLAAAVPTALVGGAFSSVFSRKTFKIDGDRSKIERMFEKRL